jgi:hypothetical protein
MFIVRSPIPHYSSKWDGQVVLNNLESQGQSDSLPRRILFFKTRDAPIIRLAVAIILWPIFELNS